MGCFVNEPCKFHEKCKSHGSSKKHHQSMFAAETLANRIEHPDTGLIATMDTKCIANIAQNMVVLNFITEAILFNA